MKYTYTEIREVKHEIELKHCPLCGSDDIYVRTDPCFGGAYSASIGCGDCGISITEKSNLIGYGDTIGELRDRVIGRWNSRPDSKGN